MENQFFTVGKVKLNQIVLFNIEKDDKNPSARRDRTPSYDVRRSYLNKETGNEIVVEVKPHNEDKERKLAFEAFIVHSQLKLNIRHLSADESLLKLKKEFDNNDIV